VGGKSQAPPPPPDYTPIANAQREIAQESLALQREQFAWAKEAYTENKGVTDQVVDAFLKTQEENDAFARRQRERYETQYQPLEDDLITEAQDYNTPERKAFEMGRAQADVAQKFDAARRASQRELEGYGIDPGATRYAALDIGVRTNQAAAEAAAGTQASERVDATGRALRSEAINVGRGYPGQIAGAYGTGLQGGTGAVNSGLATTQSGANTMGTPVQYAGVANNALSSWGNTLNQGYKNQMSNYEATQNQSSGWGTALGIAAGIGSKFLFAEGGAVEDDMDNMAVPEEASPSQGQAVDDVPARLTAGEFVIPREAVEWYGQKYFFGLIDKAQREREGAQQSTGAVPEEAYAPPAAPTFQSRGAALPVE